MKYSTETSVTYPNVVTLSQIYSMMCQRYIEDGVTTDSMSNDSEVEELVGGRPLETAVERASARLSGNHPAVPLSRKELLVSFAETSKGKGRECMKTVHSGLLTLGKHYSIFLLFCKI